jgi:hypothetical protein
MGTAIGFPIIGSPIIGSTSAGQRSRIRKASGCPMETNLLIDLLDLEASKVVVSTAASVGP